MAWLDAVPDPKKQKKPREQSRHATLKVSNPDAAKLPDIDDKDRFIVAYMDEIGWYGIGANGITSLTWVDLNAWMQATGTRITPTECKLMLDLSRVYVSQYYESEYQNCPNPTITIPQDKMQAASHFKSMFRRSVKPPS
jgi:hypothetical protein